MRTPSWFGVRARHALVAAVALAFVAGGRATASAMQSPSAPAVVLSLLVLDDASDAPLPDVRVTVFGQPTEGVTDANGRFTLRATTAGRVVLVLRRLGYQPGSLVAELAPSDTLKLTYAMTTAPHTLDSVAVTTNATSTSPMLAGFDQRRARIGGGRFVTRDEIDRRHASRTSDLFRRVLGVHVEEIDKIIYIVSSRGDKPVHTRFGYELHPCILRVMLDGVMMEKDYSVNGLSPEDLHGIEVYPGAATIPSEFAALKQEANCGLVVVWTRRDR